MKHKNLDLSTELIRQGKILVKGDISSVSPSSEQSAKRLILKMPSFD